MEQTRNEIRQTNPRVRPPPMPRGTRGLPAVQKRSGRKIKIRCRLRPRYRASIHRSTQCFRHAAQDEACNATEAKGQSSTGRAKVIGAVITAFCLCSECCGHEGGLTAWGTVPKVGVTVAAPRNVRFGTWVRIEIPGQPAIVRRVEDRTARRFDGRWDVLVKTHEEAKRFGIKTGTIKQTKP